MPTKPLTVTIPPSLAPDLEDVSGEFVAEILKRGLRQWRIEKALERYADRDISFGAAAEQAGVSQGELARQAYARGMVPPFSAEALAEELA